MICVDIGSGYNPKEGYLTCDVNAYCVFHSIDEIPDNYVDVCNIRNVLHHVENVDEFIKTLYLKCKENSIIDVIDCSEKYYYQNFCLDNLWYRYVFDRKDLFISKKFRNFIPIFQNCGFKLIHTSFENEKIILKFLKP